MKLTHRLMIPALLVLTAPLLAQTGSPAAPKVVEKPAPPAKEAAPAKTAEPAAAAAAAEVKVCLGIENKDAKDPAASFKVAADTKIYAWARLKGEPGPVSIAFKKGDKDVFVKELEVPSVPYRTNAYKTFRKGDAGDWTAVVRDATGKELASAAFKVEIE
jgi:hypothetical protein